MTKRSEVPVADLAAKGGIARAKALTPEKRSEIARRAAASRWEREGRQVAHATHEGTLVIGNVELPVAVLQDGTRVITSHAMMTALGRPWKGSYRRTELPNFISAPNLIPFITKELADVLEPLPYVSHRTRARSVIGYRAELLPLVCDVYLAAREAQRLRPTQLPTARQAEVLVRSLSKVGIVALVDEVTGYQGQFCPWCSD